MAWGVNSVLSMGVGALFASQANIQTTGNNISNVNTPGYSRQVVRQEERTAINGRPGQVGQGVVATEVIRYFDAFVEANYLDKLGTSQRFESQYTQLRYVENLFNEASSNGISNSLTELFKAWNNLAQKPDDMATREALLSTAQIATTALANTDASLAKLADQVNTMIAQDVESANQLIQEIAALNKEITANYLAGRNNPNELMDKRDAKVRELGAIIDVDVDDRGPGAYNLHMKNGCTLVQDNIPFSLKLGGPQVENNLPASSPYKGRVDPSDPTSPMKTLHFSGADNYEYTVEIVDGGDIGSGATFRVSIDGGASWLTDESGQPASFKANEEGGSQRVGELDIWFDAGTVATGDRFVISPKQDVYWVSPTAGPINISTQIYMNGADNTERIMGGSLGGLLEFRDYRLGDYRDRLDALSQSMVWEVNRIHSQGAGLEPLSYALGTYAVGPGRENVPLGSPEAQFAWAERLQSGNVSFAIFKSDGSAYIPYPGLEVFSPANFDPAVNSLQDVADAINNAAFTDADGTTHSPFTARVVDGRLELSSSDATKYSFAITDDTSGLAAALGINTFFTGEHSADLGIRPDILGNLNLINAGQVNVPGELNAGDNVIAKEIAELASKAVEIGTTWNKNTSQPLSSYYSTLVTKVGADTAAVKFTAAAETAMALELYTRQEEISGVSLDEEMSSLIKFQASYKAAAKLITTADEMLQTLLSLKQ